MPANPVTRCAARGPMAGACATRGTAVRGNSGSREQREDAAAQHDLDRRDRSANGFDQRSGDGERGRGRQDAEDGAPPRSRRGEWCDAQHANASPSPKNYMERRASTTSSSTGKVVDREAEMADEGEHAGVFAQDLAGDGGNPWLRHQAMMRSIRRRPRPVPFMRRVDDDGEFRLARRVARTRRATPRVRSRGPRRWPSRDRSRSASCGRPPWR